MASSNSKTGSYRRLGRVAAANASASARSRPSVSGALPLTSKTFQRRSQSREAPEPVLLPDDRRYYHPDPVPTYKRLNGRPARVVAAPPAKRIQSSSGTLPEQISPAALLFDNPSRVNVCVRRGVRKEVIHATGVAGSKVKPGKYSPKSKVRC